VTAIRQPTVLRRRRSALVRQASLAHSVADLFEAASARLRALVPYDACAWLMTDPATGLPTAPTLIEGFTASAEVCTEHWRREFLHADINRFSELARADRPAAALRATAIEPRRSLRYRRFIQPLGFADELRAVLRAGHTPWADVTLWRRDDRPAFSAAETDLVAGLSAPLAEALRRQVHAAPADRDAVAAERPGLLLFDDQGRLLSANEYATTWLEELPRHDLMPTRIGLPVPLWLLMTAARARDSLTSGGDGIVQTRVRSRRGRWIVGHASATRDAGGSPAGTAVTIEPASPALVAPILAEVYGLTEREREVTRQIARGAGTGEIARALYLSPHTVRDHVKSTLAKVGVSSRGELIATLYAEQFEADHLAGRHGDITEQ
jgi:DNA-binding CsgD family transcriptional regulator